MPVPPLSRHQEIILPGGIPLDDALAVVTAALDDFVAFLRKAEWVDDAAIYQLNLAYEELVSNLVRHARHFQDRITVGCDTEIRPKSVTLRIADDAPPFNPFAAPAADFEPVPSSVEKGEGGLGLRLVRALYPDGAYAFLNGRNVVSITHALGGAAGKQ